MATLNFIEDMVKEAESQRVVSSTILDLRKLFFFLTFSNMMKQLVDGPVRTESRPIWIRPIS